MVFVGLAVIAVFVAGCVVWTARILSMGLRDARALASKLSVPHPRSAAQWPELEIDRMIDDVDASDHVMLVVRWPAHPSRRALLVVQTGSSDRQRLERWCVDDIRVFPSACADDRLTFRRRRSGEQVDLRLLEERAWDASQHRRGA